jgi:hypothetical protein
MLRHDEGNNRSGQGEQASQTGALFVPRLLLFGRRDLKLVHLIANQFEISSGGVIWRFHVSNSNFLPFRIHREMLVLETLGDTFCLFRLDRFCCDV